MYKTMLSYCLKCKKGTKSKKPKVGKRKKTEKWYLHQTVPLTALENQDLLKSKKLVDC